MLCVVRFQHYMDWSKLYFEFDDLCYFKSEKCELSTIYEDKLIQLPSSKLYWKKQCGAILYFSKIGVLRVASLVCVFPPFLLCLLREAFAAEDILLDSVKHLMHVYWYEPQLYECILTRVWASSRPLHCTCNTKVSNLTQHCLPLALHVLHIA